MKAQRAPVVVAFLVIAGCGEKDVSPGVSRAYREVRDEAAIATAPAAQVLTLAGDSGERGVVLKVPPGAVPAGVMVRARVVGGLPLTMRAPVGDVAVEITPATVMFAHPVRARLRVPAPAPTRRYAAVQVSDASRVDFVQRSAGRRVELGSSARPDTEVWEIDIESGGVWGVAEHDVPLGQLVAGGAVVTDEVQVTALDEPQLVYVGPVASRRAVVVPVVTRRPTGPIASVSFQTAADLLGGPVTIQTVEPPPARLGPVPLAATAIRVVPPADLTVVGTGLTVAQALPLVEKTRVVVNAPEASGDYFAVGPASLVRRSNVFVPGLIGDVVAFEYDIPEGGSGYWGLTMLDDPVTQPPGNPVLTWSQVRADFGSVKLGATSAPLSFTLTNTGTGATGGLAPMITGENAAAFSLTTHTCTAPLSPGQQCTATVVFAPPDIASVGPVTARLAVGGEVASPELAGEIRCVAPNPQNLVINGGFDTNLMNWRVLNPDGALAITSATADAAGCDDSAAMGMLTASFEQTPQAAVQGACLPATGGAQLSYGARFRGVAGGAPAKAGLRLVWYSTAACETAIGETAWLWSDKEPVGAWRHVGAPAAAPVGAAGVAVQIAFTKTATDQGLFSEMQVDMVYVSPAPRTF